MISRKIGSLFLYSENYQSANIGKTLYLHLSKTPFTEPLEIAEGLFVESADQTGYIYLGVWFICSDLLKDHILKNINTRKVHLHKFYAWLEDNEYTPIQIKLLVLYGCVFAAIFYCSETWYEIDAVCEDILLLERQALKRCLGVKTSTPDDIIYTELNRPNIVNSIKEQQRKFFDKLPELEGNAIVCDILDMCSELDVVRYYNSLTDSHCAEEISERRERMNEAESTYVKRYKDITELKYCYPLYESFLREDLRLIITRWRLSCIPLKIETDRYKGIDRDKRLCPFCNVVEDEKHAVFICEAYEQIRTNYVELLAANTTIGEILNPRDFDTAHQVGCFLKQIEETRKSLVGRH